MQPPDRPSKPWFVDLPEGTPGKSWVVVALGESGDAFLAELPHHEPPKGAQQVVVVCGPSATHIPPMPHWVTVVPIPDLEHATLREARRVGLTHAAGDVVHFASAADLMAGRESQPAGNDWTARLNQAGVGPPSESGRRAP